MALFALGDLHLSFGVDKSMSVFGDGWHSYTERLESEFSKLNEDDVCVLCGDISWGMSFEESLADFSFLSGLPSKKIILKGNHDYWWSTSSKMREFFNKNDIKNISILHNNCHFYKDIAICGTRGWMTDHTMTLEQNAKILNREALRLRASLNAAKKDVEKICFFHYPPRFKDIVNAELISIMREFGVKKCYYGHIHSQGHRYAVQGNIDGIFYEMVSADYLGFSPKQVLS